MTTLTYRHAVPWRLAQALLVLWAAFSLSFVIV